MHLFKKKKPETLEEQRIKKLLKREPKFSRKKMLEVYETYKSDGKILMPKGSD